MLAEACLDCFVSADVARATALARDACVAAAAAGPGVQAFAATMRAVALLIGGRRDEASALLDDLLPALRSADPLTEAGQLVSLAALCSFWLERYDVASELLQVLTSSARRGNAPAALLMPLTCSAELDMRTGRWAVAAAQLHEAAALGEEMDQSVFAAYPLQCLAWLAAARGEAQRCHEYAGRSTRLVERHNNEVGRIYVHSALGLLELGIGRSGAAVEELEQARDVATKGGLQEPNLIHWQADLVEAYARAGADDAARRELGQLESQAEATGGPWALGVAARCRGILSGGRDGEAHFAAALEHLEAARAPFDVARTQLCRGEQLRRSGRRSASRDALAVAAERFEALGATPWAARADAELRACGAARGEQGARSEELTPHELQVARIVAQGSTNREAAAALFVSPKTIEYHLANTYRKLGVRTRTELALVATTRGWLDASGQRSDAKSASKPG
jgi:ATP/maltotriose-dependent transcriptional regulator MalT